jgi:hypothetical protein
MDNIVKGKLITIPRSDQLINRNKSTVAANILCVLSLSLAKCSVLALVLRIIGSKSGMSKKLCIGLMMVTAVWCLSSSLAWLVNCRADALLTVNNVNQCPGQV